MCPRFDEWFGQIKDYCETNGFDFEKAKHLSKSWNKENLVLQYHDPEKGKMGLLDETPMPVVLWIKRLPNGALTFEQTEHTKKYLS